MGSHGRTGIARAVVGSTAEEVIRLSDVPVAVAHADDMLRAGPIAVAIDASDAADAALTIGIALARAVPCELHLFHVFGRADLKGSVALRCQDEEIGRVDLERPFPELRCQRIELLRSGKRANVVASHLLLADHVHDPNTTKDDAGATERLESEHPSDDALDRPVVLLNDVIEILARPIIAVSCSTL